MIRWKMFSNISVATIMNYLMLASMCLFLVIVGVVMYYLNTRMKTIEASVAQQNIMMSDVVASIRKDVYEAEVEVDEDEELTIEEEPEIIELEKSTTDERVYVSDDSAEESDTETDAEIDDNIKESVEQSVPVYKNMKVDELRKLIQDSELTTSDKVGKMKKQEMIDMLLTK